MKISHVLSVGSRVPVHIASCKHCHCTALFLPNCSSRIPRHEQNRCQSYYNQTKLLSAAKKKSLIIQKKTMPEG